MLKRVHKFKILLQLWATLSPYWGSGPSERLLRLVPRFPDQRGHALQVS